MRPKTVGLVLAVVAAPAHACTLCHSALADQVRAGVADGGPAVAAAVSAPAVVLAGLIALAVRWAR